MWNPGVAGSQLVACWQIAAGMRQRYRLALKMACPDSRYCVVRLPGAAGCIVGSVPGAAGCIAGSVLGAAECIAGSVLGAAECMGFHPAYFCQSVSGYTVLVFALPGLIFARQSHPEFLRRLFDSKLAAPDSPWGSSGFRFSDIPVSAEHR